VVCTGAAGSDCFLAAAHLLGCASARACIFGGDVQTYKSGFGQQFAFASSQNAKLRNSNATRNATRGIKGWRLGVD
jgi:hypothetical protein